MRTLLFLAVAGIVGVISADANAGFTREGYPGAACSSASPSGAADITFNTNGEVHNTGTVTRVVVCPVPIFYQINAGESVTVNVYLKQSTACTLRISNTDGTVFRSIAGTAAISTLRFDASELGFFSANMRCSIPAGGRLLTYDVQRRGD